MNNTQSLQNTTSVTPWKIISSSVALDEKWFHVRKDQVQLPSGKVIDDYFLWESPEIVEIVPVTKDGKFVICQQYRHAVGKIMYQFPGGAVDPGENLIAAAKREMTEETGYTAGDELVPLVKVAAYATKLTGWINIFLATKVTFEKDPEHNDQEETQVTLVTAEELEELIQQGQFQVPSSLSGALLALRRLKV